MPKRKSWIVLLVVGLALLGCQKKGEENTSGQADTTEATYTPPSDGKITSEQAETYIKAAKLLNETVLDQEKAIHEFVKIHKLSDDLHELQDSLFLKEHPKVKEEYEGLFLDSQKKLDEVYLKVGVNEAEFTWIGGALADSVNEEVRKKVEEALRPPTGDGGL